MKYIVNKAVLIIGLSTLMCAHTAHAGMMSSVKSTVLNKKVAAVGALLAVGYCAYKYVSSEKGRETLFGREPSTHSRNAYGHYLDTKGKEGLLPRWWKSIKGLFVGSEQ